MIRIVLLSLSLICFTFQVEAKRIVITQSEDLKRVDDIQPNRYIVKADVDLGGGSLSFAPNSTIVFRNGSFSNGNLKGSNTKVISSNSNVFRDCMIEGTWSVNYASSLMFDDNLPAIQLFKNMACLSSVFRLYSNRVYFIDSQDEVVHVSTIESGGKDKPTILFHTTDPNIPGINLIGDDITLRNLIIVDDYAPQNDAIYGTNNNLIGNTITIIAENDFVGKLSIEGCDFKGGTSSSFVASSQVKRCVVKDCSFSGYMADHGIYCSIQTEVFDVYNCDIFDVTNTIGLFKVRDSNFLQSFRIKNVTAHNFNGYLVAVSFLSTPWAVVDFDNISIKKDSGNDSIFYGFCLSNGIKGIDDNIWNVDRIRFTNCTFGYGYGGCTVIYPGAGKHVIAKAIHYNKVNALDSNFGGGSTQELIVKHSHFHNLCGDRGILIQTKSLIVEDTRLSRDIGERINCLFLVNNSSNDCSLLLRDVSIALPIDYLFCISHSNNVELALDNCNMRNLSKEVYLAPSKGTVEYSERRCRLSRN